ncbi:MAG: signal peptide peptidase SppA [Parvularcula sp.]|nr:signal peptide peptidase SppA [Parvularcula sp.]
MTDFSSSTRSRLTVWQFIKGFAKVVVGGALLLQALLFLILITAVLALVNGISDGMEAQGGKKAPFKIDEGSALMFNPAGLLAETTPAEDPFEKALEEAFGSSDAGQVSVHELVRAIEAAQNDERISSMVVDLSGLIVPDIYASKAHQLADAIEAFRESGKRVVAVADNYGQNQYMIASEADEVLMHTQGFVFMTGYGRFRTYYSSLLDKLDVTKNIFRVGTYKSALEPILRDDMSPAAEEANAAYLSVLWDRYTSRIDENRNLGAGSTERFANQIPEVLTAADGDIGLALVNGGFVDRLITRQERESYLEELVGKDADEELRLVELSDFTENLKKPTDRENVDNIAIVYVEGAIVDGDQETGVASGEYVSSRLREARLNEDVKAVVLRVDSPGGSVFASELIRNEVQALRAAGKPVVASMGSLAASGGYWVSANADRILADETTITGSIGIFGYVPTFEKLAERIGVYTDGVGTTPMSSIAAAPIGALPEEAKVVFQQSIEKGYRDFLSVVSGGRDMPIERVAEIAEGRVWVGADALDLGLVDEFGGLEDALVQAAELAGMEDYDVWMAPEEKSQFEQFLESLTAEAATRGVFGIGKDGSERTFLGAAAKLIEEETRYQATFTDPNGLYVRCLECEIR